MGFEQAMHAVLQTSPPDRSAAGMSLDTWWAGYARAAAQHPDPFCTAVVAGARASCVGFAFASGYEAAMWSLAMRFDPSASPQRKRALCATEAKGNHPRAIETALTSHPDRDGYLMSGQKTYVTLGDAAEELLVIAREGTDAEGRPRLAALWVDAHAPGVRIEPGPPTPFVPEVPHASLVLTNCQVPPNARVPGDGYTQVLKSFRTIEDIHVFAALLAHGVVLLRRAGADLRRAERASPILAALSACAGWSNPLDPIMHLTLGPQLEAGIRWWRELPADPSWSHLDAQIRADFERDSMIMKVAHAARQRRWERAREEVREQVPKQVG